MNTNKLTEKPIYESNLLGHTVKVFSNHVKYKRLFNEYNIPLNQIANVHLGIMTGILIEPHVVIETTGGKKIKIPTFKRKQLRDAILGAINNT